MPERRFIVTTSASTQLGRIWSHPSQAFAKLQGSLQAHWLPQASGDDYEMQAKIQAGKTFGEIPFDELFVLGVERDNDLWLRAHIGTRDGRKGNAPLGRNYFLSNWELDKNVYSNGLITLKLGPFLDIGRSSTPSPGWARGDGSGISECKQKSGCSGWALRSPMERTCAPATTRSMFRFDE